MAASAHPGPAAGRVNEDRMPVSGLPTMPSSARDRRAPLDPSDGAGQAAGKRQRSQRKAPMRLLIPLIAVMVLPALQAIAQGIPAYVGTESCTDCHDEAAALWRGSHHALAWTPATPENVKADFDGTEFSHDGMVARFRIDADGSYHVNVTETDGTTTDYRVHSVAGITPLQQYLIETEPGRIQSFDVVWDTVKGGWFHLYPDQPLPPDDGLHWTGPYKTWNARCAECHATNFRKNYDAETRSYASTEAEIGVGCEACHGPGQAHLDWAAGREIGAYAVTLDRYGFSESFDGAEATIQQCAGCHSRREPFLDGNPLPGTPYADAYNLALLRPGQYHADGQILDEVYVYGSFLQSKMYAKGVSCLNCHDPHSGEQVADGNAICTQCHSPAGNPTFPTIKPMDYDSPEHHFHAPGTAGAECKSCHMIERVYMGVDGRRDHSFRIPRPDLAAVTGAPDACTDCHADKTADWAAARLTEWYPDSEKRGAHYGVTLAEGRNDPVGAAGDLEQLAADTAQPGIVRATALWLLEAAESPESAERMEPLLNDPDPLVRAAAIGVQRGADPQQRAVRLIGLLDDPVRLVRMEAARGLIDAPIAHLPEAMAANLRRAFGEWQAAMSSRLDFPETHLQLGGLALTMRNPDAAAGAFREVVEMDPQQVDAWVMLVRIAAAVTGPDAAREVVSEALAANPGDARLESYRRELDARGN